MDNRAAAAVEVAVRVGGDVQVHIHATEWGEDRLAEMVAAFAAIGIEVRPPTDWTVYSRIIVGHVEILVYWPQHALADGYRRRVAREALSHLSDDERRALLAEES